MIKAFLFVSVFTFVCSRIKHYLIEIDKEGEDAVASEAGKDYYDDPHGDFNNVYNDYNDKKIGICTDIIYRQGRYSNMSCEACVRGWSC